MGLEYNYDAAYNTGKGLADPGTGRVEKEPDQEKTPSDVPEYRKYSLKTKLLYARDYLQRTVSEKSGYNPSKDYGYSQLQDFLPQITTVCKGMGICPVFTNEFTDNGDFAVLTLSNVDDASDEPLVFRMRLLTDFNIPGANAMQILGAAHTYCRRYLYTEAFEVCVPDVFDAIQGTYDPYADQPRSNDVQSGMFQSQNANEFQEAQQAAVPAEPDSDSPLTSDQYAHLAMMIREVNKDSSGTFKSALSESCHSYSVRSIKDLGNLTYGDAKSLDAILSGIYDSYMGSFGDSGQAPSDAAESSSQVSQWQKSGDFRPVR